MFEFITSKFSNNDNKPPKYTCEKCGKGYNKRRNIPFGDCYCKDCFTYNG